MSKAKLEETVKKLEKTVNLEVEISEIKEFDTLSDEERRRG